MAGIEQTGLASANLALLVLAEGLTRLERQGDLI